MYGIRNESLTICTVLMVRKNKMATDKQIESLALKLLSMGEKRSIAEILGRLSEKKIMAMPIKELRSKVMSSMNKGGMTKKKKGYSKGGANMKKKGYAAGGLKAPSASQSGLKKLPKAVRNNMGYMNEGGMPKKKKAYAKGGKVAMYNVGGMVKSSGEINTGIARPKNTYK